ncbi:right-handed parallel beta-helix repeat-containing protein [Bradyrhizobium diazoefficiens]|uniref:right-handed parallel beta-helix repeat-containing protein n=1 Tax=Bradyrhizobium diazoefficiens TaxID=1355477 RepID=UPI0027149842|nr:right-handed parallel beta-helix repeat-containing protein [Bradyrhizobium diazoefficiens]WLA54332.1 right-handed parallel beta-helix repeat-containing protein [Bradyrhizobium diazoefficiens]
MKRFFSVPFAVVGAMISLLLIASPASAQASRTWVSGVGDDANPCSRTAPCKTFAGAISKTAVNGEINCLDPGGFGTVTITKSITIDCHEVFASILNAGVNGINIAFDSFSDVRKTVNIRNLNLQGFDTGVIGIRIFGAGAGSFVNIEDCLVNGNFSSTATGIADQRTNGTLNVVNTTLRDMGGSGITMASAGGGLISATLSNIRVINAASGVAVGNGAAVHLSNSLVSSNSVGGVVISGGGINVDSTTISFNAVGVKQTGGTVNLSNNDVSFNSTGVSGVVNSYSNNRFTSNGAGGTITPIGSVSNPTGQK